MLAAPRTAILRLIFAGLAAAGLSGCGGGVVPPARPSAVPPAPRARATARAPARSAARPPAPAVARPPARLSLPGLESVVGASAAALVRDFGQPRLDIHEGDARKLQFAGGACVLDIYLYPPPRGGEPRADYVDARLPDGRDADRAGCVAALRR